MLKNIMARFTTKEAALRRLLKIGAAPSEFFARMKYDAELDEITTVLVKKALASHRRDAIKKRLRQPAAQPAAQPAGSRADWVDRCW